LRHKLKQEGAPPVFKLGTLAVDLVKRTVRRGGSAVHLTPKEYDLLRVLVLNAGKVVTQRQLLEAVWGPAHVEDASYLRVYIGQLRRKIEAEGEALIENEPGVGYRLRDE